MLLRVYHYFIVSMRIWSHLETSASITHQHQEGRIGEAYSLRVILKGVQHIVVRITSL